MISIVIFYSLFSLLHSKLHVNNVLTDQCCKYSMNIYSVKRVRHNFQLRNCLCVCSVAQSCPTLCDSLWSHEPPRKQSMLPCPSPSPSACSNSCPLSQWCHLTISSSVVPFSPCLKSFPASGSFPRCQFFASGGQSIRASALALVLPMKFRIDFL